MFNKKRRSSTKKNVLWIQLKLNLNKNNSYKIITFTIFIILIILSTINFLPKFKVQKIEIFRWDDISNIPVAYMATENFKDDYIFFINKQKISDSLKNYQENLKDIEIKRNFPNKIEIHLLSYNIIYKTNINDSDYYITTNWVLIPKNNKDEELYNINIKNIKFPQFLQYKKLLKTKDLKTIKYIENKISDNLLNINILDLNYYQIEKELHVKISNDTLLIFDLDWDIDKQIKKILIFDKENTALIKPGIIYIDLRINNKIFYCLKENKNICNNNLKKIYN